MSRHLCFGCFTEGSTVCRECGYEVRCKEQYERVSRANRAIESIAEDVRVIADGVLKILESERTGEGLK